MKWGMGLNLTRTSHKERLATLLMIGTLASIMLMLIGLAAESRKLHYQFQANTVRKYRVLSLMFLGLQVVKHTAKLITIEDLKEALENLQYNESRFYEC